MTKGKFHMDTTFPDPKLAKSLRVDRIFAVRGCAPQYVKTPVKVEVLTERGKISKTPPLDNYSICELPGGKEIVILDSASIPQKEARKAEVVRRERQESVIYYSVVLSYFVVCLVVLWVSLFFVLS